MEILIQDISDEGLTLVANAPGDAWFSTMMHEALSSSFEAGDHADLSVTCLKSDRDIDVIGLLSYTCHPQCDRCLKPFGVHEGLELHLHLSPLHERERRHRKDEKAADEELVRDDLEFSFYEGDRFELDDILREQLLLSQPMKRLCHEACLGLCQRCGKNLNDGPCGCEKSKGLP